jgi:hypothetical protein
MQEYHAAVRGAPVKPAPFVAKDGKGSLGRLIKQYRNSRDWCELLSAGTRKQRGPILMHLEETAGDIPLVNINRAKIEEGISARTQNRAGTFTTPCVAFSNGPSKTSTRPQSDGRHQGQERQRRWSLAWPIG